MERHQALSDGRGDICIAANFDLYLKALECMRVLRGDIYTEVAIAIIRFRREINKKVDRWGIKKG